MADGSNRPIIIKRKKVISGGGHHGGAWKVAYADFVTAMMAFFLLMWLLNATTESQRKGLADYFDNRIPIARISGGGDGAFKGDSMTAAGELAESGGGVAQKATGHASGRGDLDEDPFGAEDAPAAAAVEPERALAEIQKAFDSMAGKGDDASTLLSNLDAGMDMEGLVIDFFEGPDAPLFVGETAEPTPMLEGLAAVVASVAGLVDNDILITGVALGEGMEAGWSLASERAVATRALLIAAGVPHARIVEVGGRAAESDDRTRDGERGLVAVTFRTNR